VRDFSRRFQEGSFGIAQTGREALADITEQRCGIADILTPPLQTAQTRMERQVLLRRAQDEENPIECPAGNLSLLLNPDAIGVGIHDESAATTSSGGRR
jgi:hypothetical protein